MKKMLTILVALAAIGLTGRQIVALQAEPPSTDRAKPSDILPRGDATEPVDESQIIVAQYEWNGTHQISLADLKAAIGELSRYRRENYETKAGKAEYLEELIDERLKLLHAIEDGFDKDEALLKKREAYKHQLMIERLTQIEIDEKISYTEDELEQYYESKQEELVFSTEAELSKQLDKGEFPEDLRKGFDEHEPSLDDEVVVEVQSKSSQWLITDAYDGQTYVVKRMGDQLNIYKENYVDQAKARVTSIMLTDKDSAQEVLQQIKGGKDMVEMAKELSEKGQLFGPGSNPDDPGNSGLFSQHSSLQWRKFMDVVFEQEIGEMTEEALEMEIDDKTYYIIFRKEEHIPKHYRSFEDVRERAESAVRTKKESQRITEWVEAVRKTGRLKTYPDRLPESLPDADTAKMESDMEKTETESGESDSKSDVKSNQEVQQ